MSWDPRSILYLTQLPLRVDSYVKGEQPYERFKLKESACYSCPDLLEAIDEEGIEKLYCVTKLIKNSKNVFYSVGGRV